MAWVTCGHHVFSVEHLLGELWDGEHAVLLAPPAGERNEPRHEEVQTREWHHVDRQFAKIGVQLSGEPQAGGDAAHGDRDEMVEVAVRGRGEFESAETDVVQGLVVNAERLIRVLHQLMHRQRGVVGLHHSVRNFGRGHHAEGVHDAVGILLADLANQESSHARACSSSQRMSELEALQTVTALGFLTDHVHH